jgi:ABC-type glycerol-3-phosphate transport system substrate-binding protein
MPTRLVLVLAALLMIAGCGGGGGSDAARQVSRLDEWLRSWTDDVVRNGDTPNSLRIPTPPHVNVPPTATQLGRDVDGAATGFSSETGITYQETKDVFCTWFGWYIETGTPVPSPEQFPDLLIEEGFNRVFTRPPSQQLRGAINLLQNSIAQAQSEPEAVANASAAVACSVPAGSG